MTDILLRNSGTLDKYMGDAVMGFWNAPLDTPGTRGARFKTAVEMVTRLEELNDGVQGAATTSARDRHQRSTPARSGSETWARTSVFEYTVIGDDVNLASRLEGVNKHYGTEIIVSDSTFGAPARGPVYLGREIDLVKVKGKQKPVRIYEVFPDLPAFARLKSSLGIYNEGLTAYYARQWNEAIASFKAVIAARGEDKASSELSRAL